MPLEFVSVYPISLTGFIRSNVLPGRAFNECRGVSCIYPVCSRNSPQPCLDLPKSKWHDGQSQINEAGKYFRENAAFWTWHSCSGVPRGCVNRIRLWPLRRDDHSGVLIGAGGERRPDWPAHVLTNGVSMRIDRLHACRHKWQLATTKQWAQSWLLGL